MQPGVYPTFSPLDSLPLLFLYVFYYMIIKVVTIFFQETINFFLHVYGLFTYLINIFPDTVPFSPCDTGILSHNLIDKRSTSKITIKYVINRLLHGLCHMITRISPQKTSISPSQAWVFFRLIRVMIWQKRCNAILLF